MGEELADSERALQRLQRTKGPMGSQWLTQEVLLYSEIWEQEMRVVSGNEASKESKREKTCRCFTCLQEDSHDVSCAVNLLHSLQEPHRPIQKPNLIVLRPHWQRGIRSLRIIFFMAQILGIDRFQ